MKEKCLFEINKNFSFFSILARAINVMSFCWMYVCTQLQDDHAEKKINFPSIGNCITHLCKHWCWFEIKIIKQGTTTEQEEEAVEIFFYVMYNLLHAAEKWFYTLPTHMIVFWDVMFGLRKFKFNFLHRCITC
jgi:hypothetical protein